MSPYGTCSSSHGGTSAATGAGRAAGAEDALGRCGAGACCDEVAGRCQGAGAPDAAAGRGAAGEAACACGAEARCCWAAGAAGRDADAGIGRAEAPDAAPLPPMVNANGTGWAHAWASADATASWISGF